MNLELRYVDWQCVFSDTELNKMLNMVWIYRTYWVKKFLSCTHEILNILPDVFGTYIKLKNFCHVYMSILSDAALSISILVVWITIEEFDNFVNIPVFINV